MNKTDGRKLRWLDCDWNNFSIVPNGCSKCRVCKYLDFLDWASSVGVGQIEYNKELDDYLEKRRNLRNSANQTKND